MTAQFGRTGMPHDLRTACRWMQRVTPSLVAGETSTSVNMTKRSALLSPQKERVHADRLRNSLFQACQPVKPRTIQPIWGFIDKLQERLNHWIGRYLESFTGPRYGDGDIMPQVSICRRA